MKLVKEHILFEKFTDESDPIADMKIGFPWAHIKYGDIIRSKEQIYLYVDNRHKPDRCQLYFNEIKNRSLDWKISTVYYSVVMTVKKRGNTLYIEAIPFNAIGDCIDLLNNKNDYQVDWKKRWIWFYKSANIMTWNKYFYFHEIT